ncbi:thiaminase II [Sulfuracidifex metallicus]|uniref:thiaminase II n=1 Tax=Sulfuracidifex metallicus TaxID=47303 RepID=UPI002273D6E4|nr:thiaminase II [Sulfuracidifex metallicus]MCY0850927.1 thiaminase II [Sulfuracidifex metallicus]
MTLDPEKLWKASEDVFQSILEHPFLNQMKEGNLPEEKFRYYIEQDYQYLKEFSRVLSLLSAKTCNERASSILAEHVNHVRRNEEKLHNYYFSLWGKLQVEPSPTNVMYTSFLSSIAYSRPFYEGIAAVLPCYWIYLRVGENLTSSPNPIYDRWIRNYSGKDYETGVQEVLQLVRNIEVNEEQEKSMMRLFRMGSIFEYMFWDSAYKMERFPFALINRAT